MTGLSYFLISPFPHFSISSFPIPGFITYNYPHGLGSPTYLPTPTSSTYLGLPQLPMSMCDGKFRTLSKSAKSDLAFVTSSKSSFKASVAVRITVCTLTLCSSRRVCCDNYRAYRLYEKMACNCQCGLLKILTSILFFFGAITYELWL